jgi:hypothetical protein
LHEIPGETDDDDEVIIDDPVRARGSFAA